jgi:hypothetical protein
MKIFFDRVIKFLVRLLWKMVSNSASLSRLLDDVTVIFFASLFPVFCVLLIIGSSLERRYLRMRLRNLIAGSLKLVIIDNYFVLGLIPVHSHPFLYLRNCNSLID